MEIMKRLLLLLVLLTGLSGCGAKGPSAQVAATTLPVYEFTTRICQGTGITVTRLVTEQVSCLHDYSLNVRQVKAAEAAQTIVAVPTVPDLSGCGDRTVGVRTVHCGYSGDRPVAVAFAEFQCMETDVYCDQGYPYLDMVYFTGCRIYLFV